MVDRTPLTKPIGGTDNLLDLILQFEVERLRHQNVRAPAVNDGYILSLNVSELRTFALWACEAHGVETDRPEVLAHIIMPCDVLSGEFFGIVPTKCDIACLIIAGEVERENFLVEHFLLVS